MTWPPPTAIETTHHWPPAWFHDPNRDDHHEADDDGERCDGRLADGEAASDWARREEC